MEFLTLFLLVAAVVLLVQLLKRSEALASQLRELRAELQRYSETARMQPTARY